MTNQLPPPPPPPYQRPVAPSYQAPPAPPGYPGAPPPFAPIDAAPFRPPTPPGKSAKSSGARQSIAIIAIVLLVVGALAAGAIVWLQRGDGTTDTVAPATATATTTAAPATNAPATSAAPQSSAPGGAPQSSAPGTTARSSGNAEFDRFLDQALPIVENTRGLRFKERPHVVALDDKAFVERFQELIAQDAAKHAKEYDDVTALFQALGLLRAGQTYVEAQNALGAGGVLGYYDPESKELRVRGGKVTPLLKITIVHELTHALDDQHFNLNRPEYDVADDEVGFGFAALAEGNARRVENQYRDTLSADERRAAELEELSFGSIGSLAKLTSAFLALQIAPYNYGELFVDALVDRGGQAALDRAFIDVPATSEQVISPDKYFAKEKRLDVAPPPADGTVFEDGVVGQVVLLALLSTAVGASSAQSAADGWAGDWFVAWREGAKACVRADFVMDTAQDTSELRTALTRYANTRPGGKLTTRANALELTVCSA